MAKLNYDDVLEDALDSVEAVTKKHVLKLIPHFEEIHAQDGSDILSHVRELNKAMQQYGARMVHKKISWNNTLDAEAFDTKTAEYKNKADAALEHLGAQSMVIGEFFRDINKIIDQQIEKHQGFGPL